MTWVNESKLISAVSNAGGFGCLAGGNTPPEILKKQVEEGTITRNEAQHKVEEYWMGALRRAVQDGNIDYGSLMAGQSVGLINKSETVELVIKDLTAGIETELQNVKNILT